MRLTPERKAGDVLEPRIGDAIGQYQQFKDSVGTLELGSSLALVVVAS